MKFGTTSLEIRFNPLLLFTKLMNTLYFHQLLLVESTTLIYISYLFNFKQEKIIYLFGHKEAKTLFLENETSTLQIRELSKSAPTITAIYFYNISTSLLIKYSKKNPYVKPSQPKHN